MTLAVIGAGFGRTGTLSLKLALEQIGFGKCYHMFEIREHPEHMPIWEKAHNGEPIDWQALFKGYRASVDWPSCNLWREQLTAFPNARVILSTRDPVQWHESIMNTISPSCRAAARSEDPDRRAFGEWALRIIWDRVFDGREADREHAFAVLATHMAAVRQAVPADRLLEFDAKDGWEPLCAFLGTSVPATPYPHANSTETFKSSWR